MSAVLAIASPRRIKATHRRRRKVTAGHFVQRYYDPGIGRFLSTDPAGAGFNQYAYADNNPYGSIDPDGRQSQRINEGDTEEEQRRAREERDRRGNAGGSTAGAEQRRRDEQGTARRNQEALVIGTWWVTTAWELVKAQFTGDTPGVGLAGGAGLLLEAGAAEEVGLGLRNGRLAGGVHPTTGIPFKSTGYPNFSGVAKIQVKIAQTGTRAGDSRAANAAAGFKKTPEGYLWHHHEDGTTMELVPRDIHAQTGHTGGFNGEK